jgi:sugar phosphate isomerase/epimerase
MKLACQTLTLTSKECNDIEDIFKKANEAGFHCVDIALFEGWHNIDPSKIYVNFKYWEHRVKSALEKYQLTLCAINANFSWELTDPSEESFIEYNKHFQAVLDFARACDCHTVVIQPGKLQDGLIFYRCRNILTQHLGYLGKTAMEQGIKLAIEPHKDSIVEKPDDVLRVIQDLYPLVGCCYDPSHFVMQDIPSYQTRALLDYTYHVHIRNAAHNQMQAKMEDGLVDMQWVYDSLKECDYNQFLSIEYFNEFDSDLVETQKLFELFEKFGVTR